MGALYTCVEGYSTGKIDSPLDGGNAERGLYLSSSFRGGASAIRRELFFRVGGFPGDFFYGCEERYLSLLFYNQGYIVAYWPERKLRHKGSDYPGKSDFVFDRIFENGMTTVIRIYPLSVACTVGLF